MGVSDTVWVALIVSLVAPAVMAVLTSILTTRNRRLEKAEDYARQDAVAAQAAEAAQLLVKRQDAAAAKAAEAATLLVASNERVAKTSAETISKLDVIHALVNSNMTAAMQSEHDATVRELAMMMEVIELKRAAGREPSVEAIAAIESTRRKIVELDNILLDRSRQIK